MIASLLSAVRRLLKPFRNPRLLAVFAVAFVLVAATPLMANAANNCSWWQVGCKISAAVTGLADVGFTFVSKIIFFFTWIFSLFFGVVVAIEAWFLEIILALSLNLVNSTPVKIGFPIVLAFANLAFVGGMIVIAIATILRQEKYGVKKVLWKLVLIAILVNFGLVICGALLSLSDQVTLFFINSINPAGAGPSGNSFGNFASSIAGSFNPQNSLLSVNSVMKDPAQAANALQGASAAGTDLGTFLAPWISILATLGAFVIMVITLLVMIFMLLYRYVKLGVMLIILPLAWTAWIFPAYEEHYRKWWTQFTKQAIFPPVMVFFLWLSLKISEVMSKAGAEYNFTLPTATCNNSGGLATLGGAISCFFKGALSAPIEHFLRVLIVWGVMMAGLDAAQTLGIKFAEAGQKAIQGAGKGARTWAARRAQRGAKAAGAAGLRKVRRGLQSGTLRQYQPVNQGIGRIFNPLRRAGNAAQRGIFNARKAAVGGTEATRFTVDSKGNVSRQRVFVAGDRGKKAMNKVDALEARLNPNALKQRQGETFEDWKERVARIRPELKFKVETDEQWQKRVKDAAELDPELKRKANETMEQWQKRVAERTPSLAKKTEESFEDFTKKVDTKVNEDIQKSRKGEESLLGAVFRGAWSGFGHKAVKASDLEKLGIHLEHEDHGGDHGGGHGGGESHDDHGGGGGGGGGGHGGHH